MNYIDKYRNRINRIYENVPKQKILSESERKKLIYDRSIKRELKRLSAELDINEQLLREWIVWEDNNES